MKINFRMLVDKFPNVGFRAAVLETELMLSIMLQFLRKFDETD